MFGVSEPSPRGCERDSALFARIFSVGGRGFSEMRSDNTGDFALRFAEFVA
jgi:hypothetical protein